MSLAPAWYPLALLAFGAAPLLAAGTDEDLIQRLEAAETSREQHDLLSEIAERATKEPFSTELTDRLIAELMSEATYNNHYIMRILPQLAGEGGFSEQSLLNLASALSGEMTRSYDPARSIAKVLSSTQEKTGLSDEVFSELIVALDHLAVLNRSAAIEILAATRSEDGRYARAVENIFAALITSDHQHTRSSAIAGLSRLTRDQTMSPDVLQGLVRTAKSDPYMTVRMNALEMLAGKNIDDQLRNTLSISLAEEIITPTREVWARTSGYGESKRVHDRATLVLAELHESPYPDHVVNAWIEQAKRHEPATSLGVLKQVFARDELGREQITQLVQIAATNRQSANREMIYATLFVELEAGALEEALIGFENADNEASRIRAGYTLREQFRGEEVPDRVADVAARVVITGSNAEMRAIAAGLLINMHNRGQSERLLITAIETHPEDYEIHNAIIDLYGPDRIDELVIEYATVSSLSVSFRQRIIQELGNHPISEAGLSPGAENTLKEVARNADDYYLVQYAGDTLKARGISPPLRVALKNRSNQSKAMFVILIGLIIVNLVAAIVALISVIKLPLKSQKNRSGIRAAMVIVWLALFAGMLVLLAGGAIGFLGHNSAPSPKGTLMWNLPAYAGTLIFVFLTWLLGRKVMMSRRSDS